MNSYCFDDLLKPFTNGFSTATKNYGHNVNLTHTEVILFSVPSMSDNLHRKVFPVFMAVVGRPNLCSGTGLSAVPISPPRGTLEFSASNSTHIRLQVSLCSRTFTGFVKDL